jgi:hypothetical protein
MCVKVVLGTELQGWEGVLCGRCGQQTKPMSQELGAAFTLLQKRAKNFKITWPGFHPECRKKGACDFGLTRLFTQL